MVRDSPVHVTTQRRHYVGKDGVERVYETHLLRRSFREDGKVRNETVANLSHLPTAAITAVRSVLAGRDLVDAASVVSINRSVPHGHVAAVWAIAQQLGLPALLGLAGRMRDLALALIISSSRSRPGPAEGHLLLRNRATPLGGSRSRGGCPVGRPVRQAQLRRRHGMPPGVKAGRERQPETGSTLVGEVDFRFARRRGSAGLGSGSLGGRRRRGCAMLAAHLTCSVGVEGADMAGDTPGAGVRDPGWAPGPGLPAIRGGAGRTSSSRSIATARSTPRRYSHCACGSRTPRNHRRTVDSGRPNRAAMERCPAPRACATRAFPIASVLSARRTVSAVGSRIWVTRQSAQRARRGVTVTVSAPMPRTVRVRPLPNGRSTPRHRGQGRSPASSISSATRGATPPSRHGSPFMPASIAYHSRRQQGPFRVAGRPLSPHAVTS